MKRSVFAALAALLMILFAAPTWAAGVDDAVFSLHAQTTATKVSQICTSASPIDTTGGATPTPCSQYTTSWPLLQGADMYLVVAGVDTGGLSGATFGIDFNGTAIGDGIDIVSWTLCATGLEFASDGWPAPATGNLVTWLAPLQCAQLFVPQTLPTEGIHGVVGSFYVYAYTDDIFRVREHPLLLSDERVALTTCTGAGKLFDWLDPNVGIFGRVAFGAGSGCNPCLEPCPNTTPTEPSTWGKIKTRYTKTR